MYDSFDAFEYIDYLRGRWQLMAIACGSALLISFSASWLLPKRYTATASVVIEPPGGADTRYGTAVSAVYLESLKSYESFALSDTLFARAVQQFHLQDAQHPQAIEGLKRQVLKVSKPRDTKILEVSVTLSDAKVAQKAAQFLAEATVAMSRGESQATDDAFVEQAQQQLDDARKRLENDQKEWADLTANQPIASLQSEIDSSVELQATLRQQLVDAQSDLAEYRQTSGQFAHEQLQAAQARAALLEKRIEELGREIQDESAMLARRGAARDALKAELTVTQSIYQSDTARVREIRATAGSHAEQLRMLDPGIVPERPSSPNTALNVAAAFLVALVASLVYLSTAFAYRRRRIGFQTEAARGMRA